MLNGSTPGNLISDDRRQRAPVSRLISRIAAIRSATPSPSRSGSGLLTRSGCANPGQPGHRKTKYTSPSPARIMNNVTDPHLPGASSDAHTARLRALDEFVAAYEADHGEITPTELAALPDHPVTTATIVDDLDAERAARDKDAAYAELAEALASAPDERAVDSELTMAALQDAIRDDTGADLTDDMAAARVLDGHADYDDLPAHAQARVREVWAQRLAAGLAGLNIAHEKAAAGRPYSGLDEHGNAVLRRPGGPGYFK